MSSKTWEPLFASDHAHLRKPFNMFATIRDAVVKRKESFDIFFGGDRGSGKSSCALSAAMEIDPAFTLDHWCFTSKQFLELIMERHPPGTVIVWDELGTRRSGSSRRWQDESAHILADVVQTNRTDGLIVLATSLELSRAEKRLRSSYRALVHPVRKMGHKETGCGMAVECEVRMKHTDIFMDKTRYKLFRYAAGGRVKFITLFHPPIDIWQEYQSRRLEFLRSIKADVATANDPLEEMVRKVVEG